MSECAGCGAVLGPNEGARIEDVPGVWCDGCFEEELDALNAQVNDQFEGRYPFAEDCGE